MRGIARAISMALVAGCAGAREAPEAPIFAVPEMCGPSAGLRMGQPERFREFPPACSLPDAERLAEICAIHDAVRSPGYRPPYEEWEEPPEGYEPTPTPHYVARDAVCEFTNDDHSAARCTVEMAASDEAGEFRALTLDLRHRFHAHHGPVSHSYSTMWHVEGTCLAGD